MGALEDQTRNVWRCVNGLRKAREQNDAERRSEYRDQLEIYVLHNNSESIVRTCRRALAEDEAIALRASA